MESSDSPAYGLAPELVANQPRIAAYQKLDIRIVLSGDPGERMGKQHNLAAALNQSR